MSIRSRFPVLAGLFCLLMLPAVHAQGRHSDFIDPPGRVAYVNHSEGGIGFSPAGEDDWLDLVRNRPLSRGDRLWTDRNARLELHVGSGKIRLGPETGIEVLELDDRMAQILITEGVMNLTVRRLQRGEYYEIATPNLAFSIEQPGRYRIDVDPYRDETTIVVWEGAGEVYGDRSTFPLRSGDTVRFYGDDLRDYQVFGLPRPDPFDRYCLDRDRRLARSESLRYVDADMIGYASLDAYGSWRQVSSHGPVWFPTRVERDWAPYRDGHWVWQEPWGWTWVDNAPWGFAPSHYGRWVYVSNRWGWVPGPRNLRPVYAPALVAFVGGSRWSLSISLGDRGPIGWFPLGPRDVYVPSYRASRDYFTRVNVNNTVINNTTIINNVYNNYSSGTINVTQVNYANRSVSGAVTAVPGEVFVNSRPVRQQAIRMDSASMVNAEILRVAQVAPDQRSVRGAASMARTKPAREVFDRGVVARTPPPAAALPISARVEELRNKPGLPAQQRATAPGRSGQSRPQDNVRVIPDVTRAIDAREAGPRRGGERPDAAPAERKPLDREMEARKPARQRPAADPTQGRQPQAERQSDAREQQLERQREAVQQRQREADAQELERQQAAERQRQGDAREQQLERQREAVQQRQREVDAQELERQQAAERQRQGDAREQQAARQREAAEQRQREADVQRQRDQAAERQRQTDAREQQAARQREAAEQRQRAADAQELERQQAAERQRELGEQEARRRADEQRADQPRPPPAQARKPAARKDPRTGKDVEEAEDEDDESDDKDNKGNKDKRKDRQLR
jgi:hypothetical protein